MRTPRVESVDRQYKSIGQPNSSDERSKSFKSDAFESWQCSKTDTQMEIYCFVWFTMVKQKCAPEMFAVVQNKTTMKPTSGKSNWKHTHREPKESIETSTDLQMQRQIQVIGWAFFAATWCASCLLLCRSVGIFESTHLRFEWAWNASCMHSSIALSVSIVNLASDKSKHCVFMYHIVIDLVTHQSLSQFEKWRSSIEAFDFVCNLIESQKHTHCRRGVAKKTAYLQLWAIAMRVSALKPAQYSSDLVVISGDIYSP